MAVTIDTSLSTNPENSGITLLNLGTSSSNGLITSQNLQFGSGNTVTFSGSSGVYKGTTRGTAATPYGEAGNYFASEPGAGVTFSYATPQKYFGILWGSVDAGNVIEFYNGSTLVYRIAGTDVTSNPNGSQGADGSFYTNINFGDLSYTRAVLTTAIPAFEFNTIASATTNIPTTPGQNGTPTVVTAKTNGGQTIGYDRQPATLSGTVFLDANADGARAGGDAGVSGLFVRLYDSNNTLISTDTTDSTGLYRFNNVAPGRYTVTVTPPSGNSFSPTTTQTAGSQVNSAGSVTFDIAAGGNSTINAGVYAPVSLSGIAFTDTNGDGIRGTGDAATAGVTVQLLNSAGTVVATTTTGSDGSYSFTGQVPGTYQLRFTAPGGTVFSPQDQGGNDTADSDVAPGTGLTAAITLTSGQAATNVSAGTYTPATIRGQAFTDTNGDGVFGSGDVAASGVTVRLINAAGTVVTSTTTAADGSYSFTGVTPGTYQVQFVAPTGRVFTAQDQGGNDALDSDVAPATGLSPTLTLVSGQNVTALSAGLYTPAIISGVAFTDTNGDGIRGTGETGTAEVVVRLLNAAGAVVTSTTTAADGSYSFAGLVPGTYQVQFTAPGGRVFSAQDQGGNDALDSDVAPATGRTAAITLVSGQTAANVSAGTYIPATISGVAFTDINGDGIRGTGDAGTADVIVRLLNAAGTVVTSTTTAADGSYSFANLVPGTYQVQFVAPTGRAFTAQDQGGNDALDSDVGPTTGRTAAITLVSGQTATNVSAGTYVPATISGFAFTDTNGDGIRGTGETGAAGVTVRLLTADGVLVNTVATSGTAGAYSFSGLAPGQYIVQFVAPNGTVFSAQDRGTDDTVDSDANSTTGNTGLLTLTSGQTLANVAAGVFTPAATGTGNVFFIDANGNGIRDAGESGVAGATVRLLSSDGQAPRVTTTAADGTYAFTGVAPGTYQVQFVAPSGTVFTTQDRGTDDTVDSDATPGTGITAPVTVSSGGTITNVAAGIYAPVSISGVAFTDTNGDGLIGTGESGRADVTVRLLNAAGAVVTSTTTGTGGAYSFTGQPPGQYRLEFVAPGGTAFTLRDQGNSATNDSDVDPVTGRTELFTLTSGQAAGNVSAGVYAPATISGVAFTDTNGDGIRGTGEIGAANVNVQLLSAAGTLVTSTTTAADGSYSFANLAPGTYQVQFVAPTGRVFTAQDQGGNDALDSDAAPSTGRTAPITLVSGQAAGNVSAGTYIPATISGVAFTDTNGDGIRETGETGTANVTVQLFNANGTLVTTTTTATDGSYSFANLVPGTYQVQFVAPTGRVFTAQDQGGNDALDSDAAPSTGRTAPITLVSGQVAGNVSAGTYIPATISGMAFTDTNGDGIRETDETGTAGQMVRLLGASGTVVATTMAAADGSYSFSGVAPGTYQVQFVLPGGRVFTAQDQGGNDTLDSDVNASGLTAPITLVSGQAVTNLSAGSYTPASIGGNVFTDTNGDGLFGSGESGLGNVTVQLLSTTGAVVATTATDASGAYNFTGVTPGTYQVRFTSPSGTVFTAQDRGTNDTIDSDANASGLTAPVTVVSGQSVGTISAGVFNLASTGAGNVLFLDANGNGVRDAGETGVANAVVRLLDGGGATVAETRTGADGAYSFSNVTPGQYQVQFVAPAGTVFTARDQGTNDAIDSDVDPASGRSGTVNILSGGVVTNVAAGIYTPATIRGTAFDDVNEDGIRETAEGGRSGITVQLVNAAGTVVAATATDANGAYSFSVAPGTYQVVFINPFGARFSPQNQGGDPNANSDVDPVTGRTAPITVTTGQVLENVSAGLYTPPREVGGFVWLDANGNGLFDSSEQLLQGVSVRLLDANGRALGPTTVTDANGQYAFRGLDVGSYRIGFAPLIGTAFTLQDQGNMEGLDSDATPSNGVSSLVVALDVGTSDLRSSAGLVTALGQAPKYAPTINLGNDSNGFPGTNGPEIVRGNGGNDNLNGLGGNDDLYGDAGNDTLNGLDGDDYLDGGDGDDNVQGQAGNDIIVGGAGNDIGEGGAGNDILIGGSGDDNMQGEDGDDRLYGGSGNDILTGNAGNDVVAGGDGDDRLAGADGTDIIIGGRDSGRMSLDANGNIVNVVTGDLLEGNSGADAFVWQSGDGVDLLLDFNPNEGDTLTIYGYTGFAAVQRTADGRMALFLDQDSGFVLNNGTFQGLTAEGPFPGVRFVASTADAPRNFVSGDVVVPVLAENWISQFRGNGPITVSQPFPALDTPADPTNLSGVTFDQFVRLSPSNDTTTLPAGNVFVDAGSGYDTVITNEGFRGVVRTLLPDGSLRLDHGTGTDLLRGAEQVNFVDGTLYLSNDSIAAQIERLYGAALGRGAEQNGLNFWIDRIEEGRSLDDLANGFLGSAEFGQRYGNPSNQDYVSLLYQNVLGRAPDAQGAAFWEAILASGTSRSAVLIGFSESVENKAAFASKAAAGIWDVNENAAFTARLYDTVLQRPPELQGLSFWTNLLDSGTVTQAAMAGALTTSAEFQANYGALDNPAFVQAIYLNALDRPVDPAGLQFWTNLLNNGLSRADFTLAISDSDEHVALTKPNILNENPDQYGILLA